MKAYVCNTGIISAIGHNTYENLLSLREQKYGIGTPDHFQTVHQLPVGEVKVSNQELSEQYGIPSHYPRTTMLSCVAAQEAWLPFKDCSDGLRIALISANTVGGMDISETAFKDFLEESVFHNYNAFRLHECGISAELTSAFLGLECYTSTISTACSSSANAIMLGTKLIESNKFDVVIAGGADALSKFTVNGFNALMILDKEHCKPYDEERRGLNIGEGAAYVVLGNTKATKAWGIAPICYVSGYANTNDAHHQTATSPDGTGNRLAMEGALRKAQLVPEDIQYINLHGTGTVNNDASEGKAIMDLFQRNPPPASTTKVFTGHTLGAAGAIEAVFSYLSIKEQAAWAQQEINVPIKEINWLPITKIRKLRVSNVMSNSFGFGGNCTSLIFSKV